MKKITNFKANENYFDDVHFKIIFFNPRSAKFVLKCLKSHHEFELSLSQAALHMHIIIRLHPIQSCLIGMHSILNDPENGLLAIPESYNIPKPTEVFGQYQLYTYDRKFNLTIYDSKTKKLFYMDPCEIISSDKIIQKFNAQQAFYIGVYAGIKIK